MVHTFVDSLLQDLSWLGSPQLLSHSLKPQVQSLEIELKFLRMFLSCLATWDPETDTNLNLESMVSCIKGIFNKAGDGLYAAGLLANHGRGLRDWNLLTYKLKDKIQQCKKEIKKYCELLLSSPFLCRYFPSVEIMEFLDLIIHNLNHLPVGYQIETLQEKLLLFRNLVDFSAGRCINDKELRDFMIHVHTWANKSACLIFLYWTNEVDDAEFANRRVILMSDLLKKVNPCTSEFIGMCFGVMTWTKFSRSDTLLMGEFVSTFVDFLLENHRDVFSLQDEFQILHEALIYFISFLADPPENSAEENQFYLVQNQVDDVLCEASHIIRQFHDTDVDFASHKANLVGFERTIHEVRGDIESFYAHIPHPWSNIPRTNGLGFVKDLLGNLECMTKMMNTDKKFVPFAKNQILHVKEQLVCLEQSLQDIWELQKEYEELEDLWVQIINVAYEAEFAIHSSFNSDLPIWYNLTWLSYVLKDIKDVQSKIMSAKGNHIYGFGVMDGNTSSVDVPSIPMHTSGVDEIVVGFEDEAEVLIDRITRGTAQLDIVPIVGMGGIGKTTLAKKLFNNPHVRSYFNVRAFCSVSQEHKSRYILLDILRDLGMVNAKILTMMEDDLCHQLYKCLKGRRYLIVMDDIWDIKAWNDVKDSLPNDYNGSRVIFTTRINNVALQAKSDCSPHNLRFLSNKESWQLLQAKTFHEDPCPTHLHKVGKLIAKNCKGLALAVVVIAGILARRARSVSSWHEIADALGAYVSDEGCMDVLELSYNHLPEDLKSCLLYFAAFEEDKVVRSKRLMLLWAAEGFLPKSERNNFLYTAKQYLNDLVDRSLVIVADRSSTGGIKSCRVHDLVRDFCLTKVQDEQFLYLAKACKSYNSSMPITYDEYRLCIQATWDSFIDVKPRGPTVRSLLYFPIDDTEKDSFEPFPYSNFKFLKVLDLQQVKGGHQHFPEEVTMLVHLVYFALAKNSFRTYVPPSIANIWNLETLILRTKYGARIYLPATMWKMKRLRHVEVGLNGEIAMDDEVGQASSQLPVVESFSSVTIHGEEGEELLRRLSNVQKLTCLCLKSRHSYGNPNQLPKLDHLTKLESLCMISGGVSYPCVFNFPIILKKLSLSNFFLPWSEFSAIANLPSLEVLKLRSNAFEGQRWDVECEEYPNLRFLELQDLDVAEWIASVDSFPCLERLIVRRCDKLMEIPLCFAEVPTLKAVKVYFCNETAKKSAIKIMEDQEEMGNEGLEVYVDWQMHPN